MCGTVTIINISDSLHPVTIELTILHLMKHTQRHHCPYRKLSENAELFKQ